MTKLQVNKGIFKFELTFKTNVDMIDITVYMWKRRDIETIFTSNDVMNIQNYIGKGLVSQ